MQDYILMLIAGVVLAWFGGEFFVKGGVGLARWAHWPTAVIGVTVAAFGTSSPELLVAIHAALDGVPQISLGDVLGSNVVNVALVLAIVLALSGMQVEDGGVRRDWFICLLVPGIVYALLFDGWFSRLDAGIMMVCFFVWLIIVIRHARRHAVTRTEPGEHVSLPKTIFELLAGLALLIGAAQFVVHGGKGVATALGWSPFIVGAVVVAAATSTPELATTLIARMRGHHDVGLGNILGSNIFNVFFIASVAALIQPYAVKVPEIAPSLLFGGITVLLILPGKKGALGRWRGFVLLAVYAVYVVITVSAGGEGH
ncbi:calcium/sodium antiporter [Prosthecobacter sp.]|uniref:calcium/sodium antiporter n=1 Tax=Prosthecobacter sp. TaxID=1965333 RepID=UPI002ABBEDE6|nr:calcium/sodium antiporter [Prosthecobacter sp.]MDZ4403584.1 calcium/sodium antiporter [Prosthecobacter sp.]